MRDKEHSVRLPGGSVQAAMGSLGCIGGDPCKQIDQKSTRTKDFKNSDDNGFFQNTLFKKVSTQFPEP